MNKAIKYLVVGTERSGSSMISAILANSGANFGFDKNREWNRGSGDYEHELIVGNYKNLKRYVLLKNFSDRLKAWQSKLIISNMRDLYSSVDYAKYPPLSEYLPKFVLKAGFEPKLLVVIRKFNDFAVSRISKNGEDFKKAKEVYLNMYQTTFLNLAIYGGCIVRYEDVVNLDSTEWASCLSEATGIDCQELINMRNDLVMPTLNSHPVMELVLDDQCERLYEIGKGLANNYYLPNYSKQHQQ
jgi:hypothetical protein